MGMHRIRFGLAVVVLAAVCCLPAKAAGPAIGQPAPALTFTDLLQAPPGAKADWPSLRGKVVVLEFWATWCGGCIIEIPYLNSLVQSTESDKVQFIAVDDEDPAVVKKFLAKVPIRGWVGLDSTSKIIDAYDAKIRPRTFVIDTQGRITATLRPDQLNREQLLALADGRPVAFPQDGNISLNQTFDAAKAAVSRETADAAGSTPLFDISVRAGDPNGNISIIGDPAGNSGPYSFDVRNAPLMMLFPLALSTPWSRIEFRGNMQNARYTLHVNAPGGTLRQLAPALELALAAATGLKLSHVSREEDAWVLQATPEAASLLVPAASKQSSMCFCDPRSGKLILKNASLDDLAQTLEGFLHVPVVNETGVSGGFDAIFDLAVDDKDSARAAIEQNLGLTLTRARRSIDRIVVEAPPPPAKPPDNSPQSNAPAPSAETPAQIGAAPARKP